MTRAIAEVITGAALAACLLRLLLLVGFGPNALRRIKRLIRRRNAPLRAARPGNRRGLVLALLAAGAALVILALVL